MLTFAEVCDELRMSPKTVRKLILSGDLKATKGRGRSSPYRFTDNAVADYLKRREVQPEAAAR